VKGKKEMNDQTILERTKTVATAAGDIVMRELIVEDVQFIISDLYQLYTDLDRSVLESGDGIKIFMTAVKNKQLSKCIINMIARSGSKKSSDIASLGFRDTLKLAKAFLQVNPVKEMIDLFLELKDEVLGESKEEGSEDKEESS
jgi:hypothetical protein